MARELVDGMRFESTEDRGDPRFALLSMRIVNGGMPRSRYFGREALERLCRFCTNFLAAAASSFARLPFHDRETDTLQRLTDLRAGPVGQEIVEIRGWLISLSVRREERRVALQFCARIHPAGRPTTEDDWHLLGRLAGFVGAPRDPLTPIDQTPPNKPLIWTWTEPMIDEPNS